MSSAAESIIPQPQQATQLNVETPLSRRADIDAKQAAVAGLLREVGCERLLVLEPPNFAWLTSGASARGIIDLAAHPVLYFSAEQRWVLASNVDSQRLFDEEVNGLGFQVQEWPWQKGKKKFLEYFCANKRLACDREMEGAKSMAEYLRQHRRPLTAYEQVGYGVFG